MLDQAHSSWWGCVVQNLYQPHSPKRHSQVIHYPGMKVVSPPSSKSSSVEEVLLFLHCRGRVSSMGGCTVQLLSPRGWCIIRANLTWPGCASPPSPLNTLYDRGTQSHFSLSHDLPRVVPDRLQQWHMSSGILSRQSISWVCLIWGIMENEGQSGTRYWPGWPPGIKGTISSHTRTPLSWHLGAISWHKLAVPPLIEIRMNRPSFNIFEQTWR